MIMGHLVNWKDNIFQPNGPYIVFLKLEHVVDKETISLFVRKGHILVNKIAFGIFTRGCVLFWVEARTGPFDLTLIY